MLENSYTSLKAKIIIMGAAAFKNIYYIEHLLKTIAAGFRERCIAEKCLGALKNKCLGPQKESFEIYLFFLFFFLPRSYREGI